MREIASRTALWVEAKTTRCFFPSDSPHSKKRLSGWSGVSLRIISDRQKGPGHEEISDN